MLWYIARICCQQIRTRTVIITSVMIGPLPEGREAVKFVVRNLPPARETMADWLAPGLVSP